MALVGERQGWDEETVLLSHWHAHHDLFPHQPERSRFNRRRRQLAGAINMERGRSLYSPWLVERAVRLGTTTFRAAARLLTHFTGVAMSAATVRCLTEAAGSTMRQVELDFAATVRETGTVPDPPPDVSLQMSIDGSLIHLRAEGWRAVELLAVGERAADGTTP